mmetsp:Transcript_9046/g.36531  ORF Transcript_9046/g.36531 Transcript_9046/m.36531 type:complete len:271 (+) Transcript_9046:447-1259(+)
MPPQRRRSPRRRHRLQMNPSRPRPERAPVRRRRSRRQTKRRSGRRSGRTSGRTSGKRIQSERSAAARRRVATARHGSTIHRRRSRRRRLKPRTRTRTRGRQREAAATKGSETPTSSRRPRRLSRGSFAFDDGTSGFAPRANRASAPRSSDTRSFTRTSRGFWCWRVGGITASGTTWSGGARSSRLGNPPGGRCTWTRVDAAPGPGRGDRTAARTATSTPGTTSPATGSTGGGTRRGKRSLTSYSDARRPCERSITCVAKITRTPTAGRAS